MAVFTPVEATQLDRWLEQYDVGTVSDFRGIPAGIENTNYFLSCERGAFVLTLFERLNDEQLPFYLQLMRHLAQRGVPCPEPLTDRQGRLFTQLNGKPAALVSRLPGRWVEHPLAHHCALAGTAMARMHLAGRNFPLYQPNLRGHGWWRQAADEVTPFLGAERRELLADELAYQEPLWRTNTSTLPQGPIHADLFRDNALFDGQQLGGFIDFYFAGCDPWLFDVAVSVNDWCVDLATGAMDGERCHAFLNAYAAERPFESAEVRLWPSMLRAAALRFWLSRLRDIYLPRPAQLLTPHDPAHFERVLRLRRQPQAYLPGLPG